MSNVALWDELKEVPDKAKKLITGGRMSGKTDINPMWRWHKLTEIFGPCGVGWRFEVTEVKRHDFEAGDEVLVFVAIELSIKYQGEWSEAIPGTGGAKVVSRERGGLYVDDDAVKKAVTDALGVAAKMLGLGSDVYSQNADWTKYSHAYRPSEQAQASKAKPSKSPPVTAGPFTKEQKAERYEAILNWLHSGKANEKQISGMLPRSAELVDEGKLTQDDQRKVFTECLILLGEWDNAQSHLVTMTNNRFLTKKQVEEYMERVDAGRAGK